MSSPPTCVLIAQLARGMRRQIETEVAPLGLRPRELFTLQHLRDGGPSAQQALVELIGIDATNLVAILNSLEDAGFIERRRDRADRRRAIIELSARGERVLDELDRSLRQLDDALLADLTTDERELLNALLHRTIDRNRAECAQTATEC